MKSYYLEDVNIQNLLVSNKIFFCEKNYKYIIGCLYDDYKIKPLDTAVLPKTKAYLKSCNGQTKWMYFLIENDDLLKKYNNIWNKLSTDIKKEFDNESV